MRRAASALALSALAAACGLQVKGKAAPEDVTGDVADSSTSVVEAGDDASADAALPCVVSIEDDFANQTLDPGKWFSTKNAANDSFPKPVFLPGPLLALVKESTNDARGAVWFARTLPFHAIDVVLDVQTVCSQCGDGLTIAWLAPATAAELDDADTAETLAVPRKLPGGAVTLDLYRNVDTGEGDTPNLSVLDIDGVGEPGTYDWTVASTPQNFALRNERHALQLNVRDKQVFVRLDGVLVVQAVMSNLPAEGTFGFIGTTGGFTAGLFVGALRAKFYRCDAPPAP